MNFIAKLVRCHSGGLSRLFSGQPSEKFSYIIFMSHSIEARSELLQKFLCECVVSVLAVWLAFQHRCHLIDSLLTHGTNELKDFSQLRVDSLSVSRQMLKLFDPKKVCCRSDQYFLLCSRILDYTTFLFVQNPTDLFRIRLDFFLYRYLL